MPAEQLATQLPVAVRYREPVHLRHCEAAEPVHVEHCAEQGWHTLLPSAKLPELQLDTQLLLLSTRGAVHELQVELSTHAAHWPRQAEHTVSETGVQAAERNCVEVQVPQPWQIGFDEPPQLPDRNLPVGQVLVQAEQLRSEVGVQGLVWYSFAPQARQPWQLGLDDPAQLPARNWLEPQELATVQLVQDRSVVAVQLPVKYWPLVHEAVHVAQGELLALTWNVPARQVWQKLSIWPLQVVLSCEPAGHVVRQLAQPRSAVAVPAAVWYEAVAEQTDQAWQAVFWVPVQPPLAKEPAEQPEQAVHCPVVALP